MLFHLTPDHTGDVEDAKSLLISKEFLATGSGGNNFYAKAVDASRRKSIVIKALISAVCIIGVVFCVFHPLQMQVFNLGLARSQQTNSGCKYQDMTVRREWSSLPLEQRVAYTDAVKCLYNSPSKLNQTTYPGARNRHDDFLALHINATLNIHFSGLFLPWHRHYLHLYHQALVKECGFTGIMPYWDWTKYAYDIYNNLLFDGSAGSMSGDGSFVPHSGMDIGFGEMPKGQGGGCIASGPFKDVMFNMGPFAYDDIITAHGVLPSYSFNYNPRCLRRDLNPTLARLNLNETTVHNVIYETPTLPDFQLALSGAFGPIVNNPHAGGHFVIGGAGNDFFASAGDPTFFIHHTQVDRVWAKWQSLDPQNRMYALAGTNTIFNDPPSADTSVDHVLEMGIEDLDPPAIRDVMTRNGPLYCYRYDDEAEE